MATVQTSQNSSCSNSYLSIALMTILLYCYSVSSGSASFAVRIGTYAELNETVLHSVGSMPVIDL